MNVDTGAIRELGEGEQPTTREVQVAFSEMTMKQRRRMQVSLADHRSSLGRQLTEARAKMGASRVHLSKAERRGKTREEIAALRAEKAKG